MSNSLDEATISITSGKGGNGSPHLKREKYNAKGGPDGGNGGQGGHVFIEATKNINTLIYYIRKLIFKAEDGVAGAKNNCTGRNGKDLILQVPIGSQIFDENKILLHDFTKAEKIKLLEGGKGGAGNTNYKSSTNQAPRKFKPGKPGETKTIKIIVKTLADIGIIGKPNIGKSTFLSTITNAKVKIGDYHFTTLHPNLGITEYNETTMTICDIPGLIKGAAQGQGLGIKFLKHIERCTILIHLISAESENPIQCYHDIQYELKQHSKELIEKNQLICISKADLLSIKDKEYIQNLFLNELNQKVYFLSSHDNTGINEILKTCYDILHTNIASETPETT
ncbi:MAG: Obg family GTPase CgtA [Pseudomonadota bacterium]